MPQTPHNSPGIDPLMFAQFLVLPGAVELLTAFAAIPPGKLRDTIIDHAQALAEAHQGATPQYRTPNPVGPILGLPQPRVALPRRTDAEPLTSDPKTEAVKMRLDGAKPYEIAAALKIKLGRVYAAITEARKAGVKFPTIGRAPTGKGHQYVRFAMSLDELNGAAMATAGRAAEMRGIDLETYLGRRKQAIEMGLAGRHIRAIMEATKEPMSVLKTWFSTARAAGFPVPYMLDGIPAQFEDMNVAPPPENVVDLRPRRKADDAHKGRFILTMEEYSTGGRQGIEKGAKLMGVDVPEFLRRRREALAAFTQGETIAAVSRLVGISHKQAANWRGRAQRAGRLNLTHAGAHRRAKQSKR